MQDAPPARELIGRLAVYRRPVDDTGVAWQLSALTAAPDPPPGADRPPRSRSGRRCAGPPGRDRRPLPTTSAWTPRRWTGTAADMAELARPPVTLTGEGRQALGLLAGLGLAAPAAAAEATGRQARQAVGAPVDRGGTAGPHQPGRN